MWPLRGETRRPEHILLPLQRQIQPHKHVVQVEVHDAMLSPEPEIPFKQQILIIPIDQIGQPPAPRDKIQGESGVPELLGHKCKSVVLNIRTVTHRTSTIKTNDFRLTISSGFTHV